MWKWLHLKLPSGKWNLIKHFSAPRSANLDLSIRCAKIRMSSRVMAFNIIKNNFFCHFLLLFIWMVIFPHSFAWDEETNKTVSIAFYVSSIQMFYFHQKHIKNALCFASHSTLSRFTQSHGIFWRNKKYETHRKRVTKKKSAGRYSSRFFRLNLNHLPPPPHTQKWFAFALCQENERFVGPIFFCPLPQSRVVWKWIHGSRTLLPWWFHCVLWACWVGAHVISHYMIQIFAIKMQEEK